MTRNKDMDIRTLKVTTTIKTGVYESQGEEL